MPVANEKSESRYKLLVQPEFKSTIPDHLLARLPVSDRYLIGMVSMAEQKNGWLLNAVADGNEANRELDIRVSNLERFVEKVTNKWSVIAYIIALSLPVIIKIGIDRLRP